MRIDCNAKGRAFVVDFNQAGEPTYVSVWTKGRYGARDTTRTLWSSGRKKEMSELAAAGVAAAREKRIAIRSERETRGFNPDTGLPPQPTGD